jgi:hypothetical protein
MSERERKCVCDFVQHNQERIMDVCVTLYESSVSFLLVSFFSFLYFFIFIFLFEQ